MVVRRLEVAGRDVRPRRSGTAFVRAPVRRGRPKPRWRRAGGLSLAAILLTAGAIFTVGYLASVAIGDVRTRAERMSYAGPLPNCATARRLQVDGARRGEAAYRPHLDADGDGTACEPWSGTGRRFRG